MKLIQYAKAKAHAGQDTCGFFRLPRVGFLHTRGIRLHFFLDVDERLRNLRWSVGREKVVVEFDLIYGKLQYCEAIDFLSIN